MTTNNHPAHGPVSLDRLHQISEILSKASAQSDGGNLGYAMADAVKVIDGAIAAFGAEPVGYTDEEELRSADNEIWMWKSPHGFGKDIPLYASPQPAPVVPEEKPMPEASKMHAIDAVAAIAEVRGWNACRAAMLQGKAEPVSHPYKLPDGYCAMPKKLTAENGAKGALSGEFHVTHRITCQSCGGDGCEDCNEEGGWDGEIPIGWDTIKMIYGAAVESCALPAALQQEVNRG